MREAAIDLLRLVAPPALLLFAGSAAAHVVLAEPSAPAGSYHAAFFRVSHGCDGSAMVALRVELPASVVVAKPQPKPGWTLAVERAPLPTPVMYEGKPVHERVVAVTWTGRLADDEFDQFGLMVKLPAATGPLYFPTTQRCERGETRWTTIPAPGQAWHSVPHPAPMLDVRVGGADTMHMEH